MRDDNKGIITITNSKMSGYIHFLSLLRVLELKGTLSLPPQAFDNLGPRPNGDSKGGIGVKLI